jgi:Questin oxidase-like
MLEPLDALRLADEPVAPRPAFARGLAAKVHDELARDSSVSSTFAAQGSSVNATAYDALDEALEVVAGTGPEYDPFGTGFCLTNHVPMVAEALCALGRPDAVRPWVNRYRKYLSDAPAPRGEIVGSQWREALGHLDRVGDWVVFFETQLDDAPWGEVINCWVPRLAPASYAAGTHGVLRVAHAVRGIGQQETPLRRRELAEALGYWAAAYETLPETREASAGLSPSEALPLVEQLELRDRRDWMLFTEPLAKATSMPSFIGVADLVDVHVDPSAFLADLTEAIAALLVTNAAEVRFSRGIVHAFTAGSATRMMLPYLTPESTTRALRYGWQVAAAFYAGLIVAPAAVDVDPPVEGIDELVDEAIACPDEHGIKITEACLREYRINPKPVYLAAARACTRDLAETGLKLA